MIVKRSTRATSAHLSRIKTYCLQYPESHEDHPWGESVIKVRNKVFVFLGSPGPELSLSVKLPESQSFAMMLPQTRPTGYGLGKSGWVTATFAVDETPPMDIIEEWIEESYRAVAPKSLIKTLDSAGDATRREGPRAKSASRKK